MTSLPNAVAAIYLASRGRGAAMMSTAFNSNAINVIVGLMLPAALLGLATPTEDASFVAIFYVGLTALAVALALRGKGLDRRAGSIIIGAYLVFVRRPRHPLTKRSAPEHIAGFPDEPTGPIR